MSSSTSTKSSGGIGFAGLLALVFITLKLVGVITWSWWWVLAPIWIAVALAAVVLLVVVLVAATNSPRAFDRRKDRRRLRWLQRYQGGSR